MKSLETTYLDATQPPSWEGLLEELRQNPDVSSSELASIDTAFQILARHLGADFPAHSVARYHQLDYSLIHNRAAFPKKWLPWLAEAIEILSRSHGFPRLRSKLRRSSGFDEAMSIVRFSYRLCRANWRIEFDPAFGSVKKPDLLATSPHSHVCAVEISTLGESERDRRIDESVLALAHGLGGLSKTHVTAGRIIFAPRADEIDLILTESQNFAKLIASSNGFLEYSIPGLFELAGTPKGNQEQLENWAAERDLKPNQFRYSGDQRDEDLRFCRRLQGKLKKEIIQVSGLCYPGLVAIKCGEFVHEAGLIPVRSDELATWLSGFPSVIGIIIYGTIGGSPENRLYADPSHVYMEIQGGFYEAERWVFVPNRTSIGVGDQDLRREICESYSGQQLPWDEWSFGW